MTIPKWHSNLLTLTFYSMFPIKDLVAISYKGLFLQLLGELLLDRHNFTVMTRYISNEKNLKLMMNMLREKSKNIQFEAFHVFKVGDTVIFYKGLYKSVHSYEVSIIYYIAVTAVVIENTSETD